MRLQAVAKEKTIVWDRIRQETVRSKCECDCFSTQSLSTNPPNCCSITSFFLLLIVHISRSQDLKFESSTSVHQQFIPLLSYLDYTQPSFKHLDISIATVHLKTFLSTVHLTKLTSASLTEPPHSHTSRKTLVRHNPIPTPSPPKPLSCQ